MSHHGNNGLPPDFDPSKLFESNYQENSLPSQLMKNLPIRKLGATSSFPNGKMTEDDEGQIAFACTVNMNKLMIHFGEKPITWIGFTKEEAENLVNYLQEKIKELK